MKTPLQELKDSLLTAIEDLSPDATALDRAQIQIIQDIVEDIDCRIEQEKARIIGIFNDGCQNECDGQAGTGEYLNGARYYDKTFGK